MEPVTLKNIIMAACSHPVSCIYTQVVSMLFLCKYNVYNVIIDELMHSSYIRIIINFFDVEKEEGIYAFCLLCSVGKIFCYGKMDFCQRMH